MIPSALEVEAKGWERVESWFSRDGADRAVEDMRNTHRDYQFRTVFEPEPARRLANGQQVGEKNWHVYRKRRES